jgi:hypothetical protein
MKNINELEQKDNDGIVQYFERGMPFTGDICVAKVDGGRSECPVFEGYKNGIETTYSPDGIVSRTAEYMNGVLEGNVKTYFKNGVVETNELYFDGELITYTKHNADGNLVDTDITVARNLSHPNFLRVPVHAVEVEAMKLREQEHNQQRDK